MTLRKVLILENGSLPGAGLYSLLSELKDVEVIKTELANIEDLIRTIDTFRPHVLVLDEFNFDESNLIEVLPAIFPLPKRNSIQRIIIVYWEENMIEVYDRNLVEIKELNDFLAMF